MNRPLLICLSVCVGLMTTAAGVAAAVGGEGPVSVPVSAIPITVDAAFGPKALPKEGRTPIRLLLEGEISSSDGGRPPALQRLIVELDRQVELDLAGIPGCRARLARENLESALRSCGRSLIGEGKITAAIDPVDGGRITLGSRLLVFKGGESARQATLLLYAFLPGPISEPLVARATVRRETNDHFGTAITTRIPAIAAGTGSILRFDLETFRGVDVDGRSYHPVSARCSDGRLRAHFSAEFEDGTRSLTEVVRACTPTAG